MRYSQCGYFQHFFLISSQWSKKKKTIFNFFHSCQYLQSNKENDSYTIALKGSRSKTIHVNKNSIDDRVSIISLNVHIQELFTFI